MKGIKLFLYPLVFFAIVSCAQPAENRTDDLYRVLGTCLVSKQMAQYSFAYLKDNIIHLAFINPPIYDNRILNIFKDDYYFLENHLVRVSGFMNDSALRVQIASINQTSALVIMRIPKKNVTGTFHLVKDKKWVVDQAEVVEN